MALACGGSSVCPASTCGSTCDPPLGQFSPQWRPALPPPVPSHKQKFPQLRFPTTTNACHLTVQKFSHTLPTFTQASSGKQRLIYNEKFPQFPRSRLSNLEDRNASCLILLQSSIVDRHSQGREAGRCRPVLFVTAYREIIVVGSKVVYVASCLLFSVACTRPGTDPPVPDVRASIDEEAASIVLVNELKHQEFNNNVIPSSVKTKQELGETILYFTTTDGSLWTTNLKFLVRVPGTTKATIIPVNK